MLVPNARNLRGMSHVNLSAMVLENSKNKRVLGNRGKNCREAMEDSVVNMKDAIGFDEFRSVSISYPDNTRVGYCCFLIAL